MSVTVDFFKQPKLRDAVRLDLNGDICALHLREQTYELELEPQLRGHSLQLLELLRLGGYSIPELEQTVPALGPQLGEFCRELDRYGLLTESDTQRVMRKTGSQFYRELVRFIERTQRHYPARPLYQHLQDDTIKREQLIGYALEYYHIVRMCPGLLAPSLSHHESPKTTRVLQDFFVSELHHDDMIARSLAAVGVDAATLERLVPLPMTFSACCSLGVYARQHPMTFKAALFLFEQPDGDFNRAFERCARSRDLPEAFYRPILEHATINEDGEHDNITQVLLSEVPCISDEEQHVVRRHIAILLESLVLMDQQIVEYYGNTTNVIPRVFE